MRDWRSRGGRATPYDSVTKFRYTSSSRWGFAQQRSLDHHGLRWIDCLAHSCQPEPPGAAPLPESPQRQRRQISSGHLSSHSPSSDTAAMASQAAPAKRQQGETLISTPRGQRLTFSADLQVQYSTYKNTLQQLAQKIGDVEQEAEEHKYGSKNFLHIPSSKPDSVVYSRLLCLSPRYMALAFITSHRPTRLVFRFLTAHR